MFEVIKYWTPPHIDVDSFIYPVGCSHQNDEQTKTYLKRRWTLLTTDLKDGQILQTTFIGKMSSPNKRSCQLSVDH